MKIVWNKKLLVILAVAVIIIVVIIMWLLLKTKTQKVDTGTTTTTSTSSTTAGQGYPSATTTPTSSALTTSTEGNAMPENFKDNPTEGEKLLQLSLPTMTTYFYMQYNKDTKRYLVTRYINPNDSSMGTVDEQLEYTKDQAKLWIGNFGIDPDKLPIDYTDAR